VKHRFVEAALAEFAPKDVLDVGSDTGHFSRMAAKSGASVVAVDYDPVVTGRVWQAAERDGLDILPLVVDLTRPTPGTGWMNRENASFLDRARGSFDLVLMLAVIHHMLVTERVPLGEIFQLASELTRDLALIEFIAPEDSMFRRLTRGRDHLHAGLTNEVFENIFRAHFEPVRVTRIEGTSRWLYLLRKVRRG
jgi:SAM-dependent methyltransferase